MKKQETFYMNTVECPLISTCVDKVNDNFP